MVKKRSSLFRALGHQEPPVSVWVNNVEFKLYEVFKHDSWAATASYNAEDGSGLVCKFNRTAPIGLIPMKWLGRWLASRENWFYDTLSDVELVAEKAGAQH